MERDNTVNTTPIKVTGLAEVPGTIPVIPVVLGFNPRTH